MKALALLLALLGLVVVGCASQHASVDRTTKEDRSSSAENSVAATDPESNTGAATLGPSGLTVQSPEDDAEGELTGAEPSGDDASVDPREMQHLWDGKGQFLKGRWQEMTHEERVHAIEVLAECGNRAAQLARNQLERDELSEATLRKEGPYIASGSYGWWAEVVRDGATPRRPRD